MNCNIKSSVGSELVPHKVMCSTEKVQGFLRVYILICLIFLGYCTRAQTNSKLAASRALITLAKLQKDCYKDNYKAIKILELADSVAELDVKEEFYFASILAEVGDSVRVKKFAHRMIAKGVDITNCELDQADLLLKLSDTNWAEVLIAHSEANEHARELQVAIGKIYGADQYVRWYDTFAGCSSTARLIVYTDSINKKKFLSLFEEGFPNYGVLNQNIVHQIKLFSRHWLHGNVEQMKTDTFFRLMQQQIDLNNFDPTFFAGPLDYYYISTTTQQLLGTFTSWQKNANGKSNFSPIVDLAQIDQYRLELSLPPIIHEALITGKELPENYRFNYKDYEKLVYSKLKFK
jgi:hypothetical protein